MQESTAQGGAGAITLVSSVNGLIGASGAAGYVSSKFAVRGLAKVAALELGRDNIRVNSVHPGAIDTFMISPAAFGGRDVRPAPRRRGARGPRRHARRGGRARLLALVRRRVVLHRRRVRDRRRDDCRAVRLGRDGTLTRR